MVDYEIPIKPRLCPRFKLVKIDETDQWDEDLVKACGGKIFGIYLYNENEVTHLCELPTSYYLHFLYNNPMNIVDPDTENDIDEILMEGENIYHSTSFIDNMDNKNTYEDVSVLKKEEYETDEAYNSLIEDVIEYYRCNHYL